MIAALFAVSGCGRKKVKASDPKTLVETSATLSPEQTEAKERLEQPLFKRENWTPPPRFAGKCANCGKESDSLTQIDPMVKEVGGVCSDQCLEEWMEKNRIVHE